MSAWKTVHNGPGPSQGNSGPSSSQGSSGPGPSHGSGGPGSSQGISVPGPSQGNRSVEEQSAPDYVLTINKFKDLLKRTDRRDNIRMSNFFNHVFELEDDSSSEDENLEDQEFLREIETCQKLRVKILLELYKHMEEAPLRVWRTYQDEQTDKKDNPSQ